MRALTLGEVHRDAADAGCAEQRLLGGLLEGGLGTGLVDGRDEIRNTECGPRIRAEAGAALLWGDLGTSLNRENARTPLRTPQTACRQRAWGTSDVQRPPTTRTRDIRWPRPRRQPESTLRPINFAGHRSGCSGHSTSRKWSPSLGKTSRILQGLGRRGGTAETKPNTQTSHRTCCRTPGAATVRRPIIPTNRLIETSPSVLGIPERKDTNATRRFYLQLRRRAAHSS